MNLFNKASCLFGPPPRLVLFKLDGLWYGEATDTVSSQKFVGLSFEAWAVVRNHFFNQPAPRMVLANIQPIMATPGVHTLRFPAIGGVIDLQVRPFEL